MCVLKLVINSIKILKILRILKLVMNSIKILKILRILKHTFVILDSLTSRVCYARWCINTSCPSC